jgi:hypothetical protein
MRAQGESWSGVFSVASGVRHGCSPIFLAKRWGGGASLSGEPESYLNWLSHKALHPLAPKARVMPTFSDNKLNSYSMLFDRPREGSMQFARSQSGGIEKCMVGVDRTARRGRAWSAEYSGTSGAAFLRLAVRPRRHSAFAFLVFLALAPQGGGVDAQDA